MMGAASALSNTGLNPDAFAERAVRKHVVAKNVGLRAEAMPELLVPAERMGFAGLKITLC
jgi:hypothetical protein